MFWVQAAVFLCSIASAVVIPTANTWESRDVARHLLQVDTKRDDQSLETSFIINCRDCERDERADSGRNLNFVVQINNNQRQPASSDISINGIALTWEDQEEVHSGWIVTSSQGPVTPGTEQDIVSGTWHLSSLTTDVSLLTVTVTEHNGHSLSAHEAGFSLSYNHRLRKIVDFHDTPQTVDSTSINVSDWLEDVVTGDGSSTIVTPGPTVDSAFDRMSDLRRQMALLHDEYARQENIVYGLLSDEIKQCKGLRCYLQKGAKTVPNAYELAKSYLTVGHMGNHASAAPGQVPVVSTSQDATAFETATSADSPVSIPATDGWTATNRPHTIAPNVKYHPLLLSLGAVLIIMVLICCVLIFFGVKLTVFQDPEWRRDYATLREERRTRAAYRRAACEYRLSRFFSAFRRRPTPTLDYEEKRTQILRSDAHHARSGNSVMSHEITQLQRTYHFVNEIVRMSRGGTESASVSGSTDGRSSERLFGSYRRFVPNWSRARSTTSSTGSLPPYEPPPSHPPSYDSFQPVHFASVARPAPTFIRRRAGSLSSSIRSLPPYQAPSLPDYEGSLIENIVFAEGFHYTPSHTDSTPDESADTAESSIVDCNSEISFETGTSRSQR